MSFRGAAEESRLRYNEKTKCFAEFTLYAEGLSVTSV